MKRVLWRRGNSLIQNLTIKNKIVLFFMTLIVVSILLSMFIYNRTNTYYLDKKIKELTISEIEADNRSLELLIEDINNYSKILLSNQTLQMILKDSENLISYKTLDRELAEFINFNNKISSIYIFRNDGKKYYTEKGKLKNIQLDDIQKMPWYKQVVEKKGGYVLNINGSGLLKDNSKGYLTFFRIIRSLDNQQPLGLMMINISEDVIEETLGLQQQKDTMFIIEKGEEQRTLTFNNMEGIEQGEYVHTLNREKVLWKREKFHNNQMVIAGVNNTNYGWNLLRITPFNGQRTQMNIFKIAIVAIIVLNGVLVFFGSFFISRYITNPINKLIHSMKEVEKGHFNSVTIETHNDEIGMLKNGYNFMIKEIQKLIKEIIHEQKTLKKAEFSVIMEQIKPHFLYNTLDSISSLVMLNRSEEAYKSLRALGSFYRTSLSNGRDMVTVEKEILIIKNYLFIQKIRYGDLFDMIYEVDEQVMDYKIPKLILQPLVENSIYHGIKPMGEKGRMKILIKKQDTSLLLTVKDNGIGMSNEKVEFLNNSLDHSVGIPATKKRILTLYGDKSDFQIESSERDGTTISIKIPWEVEL